MKDQDKKQKKGKQTPKQLRASTSSDAGSKSQDSSHSSSSGGSSRSSESSSSSVNTSAAKAAEKNQLKKENGAGDSDDRKKESSATLKKADQPDTDQAKGQEERSSSKREKPNDAIESVEISPKQFNQEQNGRGSPIPNKILQTKGKSPKKELPQQTLEKIRALQRESQKTVPVIKDGPPPEAKRDKLPQKRKSKATGRPPGRPPKQPENQSQSQGENSNMKASPKPYKNGKKAKEIDDKKIRNDVKEPLSQSSRAKSPVPNIKDLIQSQPMEIEQIQRPEKVPLVTDQMKRRSTKEFHDEKMALKEMSAQNDGHHKIKYEKKNNLCRVSEANSHTSLNSEHAKQKAKQIGNVNNIYNDTRKYEMNENDISNTILQRNERLGTNPYSQMVESAKKGKGKQKVAPQYYKDDTISQQSFKSHKGRKSPKGQKSPTRVIQKGQRSPKGTPTGTPRGHGGEKPANEKLIKKRKHHERDTHSVRGTSESDYGQHQSKRQNIIHSQVSNTQKVPLRETTQFQPNQYNRYHLQSQVSPNNCSPYTQPAPKQSQIQPIPSITQMVKQEPHQMLDMKAEDVKLKALLAGIPPTKQRMGSTELCSLITLYMDLPPKYVSKSRHEAGKLKTLLPWQILKALQDLRYRLDYLDNPQIKHGLQYLEELGKIENAGRGRFQLVRNRGVQEQLIQQNGTTENGKQKRNFQNR